MQTTIPKTRIQGLNSLRIRNGSYVMYWMQQSQRLEYNHALEFAIHKANKLGQKLLVVFGLSAHYPEANLRHYTFMLQGLKETQSALSDRGIKMVIQRGCPSVIALILGADASLIVCDRGYLKHQKAWRNEVSLKAHCAVVQVESDVIVPVEIVSDKAEYAARTIRSKIKKNMDSSLVRFRHGRLKKDSLNLNVNSLDLTDIDLLLKDLNIDRSVPAVSPFLKGGTTSAKKSLKKFIRNGLPRYGRNRNQPQTDDTSQMSLYLHFGQISPLHIALQIKNADDQLQKEKETFLEELIVRRELSINFVHYNQAYDSFDCLPDWAKKTLAEHRADKREPIYTREQLENAKTHDDYWNASMKEMKYTGFMHGYMRMYWGKKILEWSDSPENAFRTALAINNKYFIDGRDPNSYAGVAWLFGLHDRAWNERPIFGKIRYMSASGLERKCDIHAYLEKVEKRIRFFQKNRTI